MAGAYKLLMTRTKVTVSDLAGSSGVFERVQVTVRDGVANLTQRNGPSLTMPATSVEKISARHAVVTGPDGTKWDCQRKGGG